MWLTGDHFVSVFWIAVIPAFFAFAVIVVAVHEPQRAAGLREVNRAETMTMAPSGTSYG
jgi:TRAP-type uncharacterized transport system fused permease subunit